MDFDTAFRHADQAIQQVRDGVGLRDVERDVLSESWDGQTYDQMAVRLGYTKGYLSRDVGPHLWQDLTKALEMPVSKKNFRTAIERWMHRQGVAAGVSEFPLGPPDNGLVPSPSLKPKLPADWGSLRIAITGFCGRDQELTQLSHWALDKHSRLIGVVGVPGVGKTWLAVKFLQQNQQRFHRVVYLSLEDRPTPQNLVLEILTGLNIEYDCAVSFTTLVRALVQELAQKAYALVIDGVEVFHQVGDLAGSYSPTFEDYDYLLQRLRDDNHRSCVLWVGREMPSTLSTGLGARSRCLVLKGLSPSALEEWSLGMPSLQISSSNWQIIHRQYGGIPRLMQHLVAHLQVFGPGLQANFQASLQAHLQAEQSQADPLLPAMVNYLDDWLTALSESEQAVLTELAIGHRPLSPEALSTLEGRDRLALMLSLQNRGLCQLGVAPRAKLTLVLPSLLGGYLCERWVSTFRQATFRQGRETDWLQGLHRYPLIQPESPEHIQRWQRRHLLEPIAAVLADQIPVADRLPWVQRLLQASRELPPQPQGFSPGNLLNLAQHWQLPLVALDCCHLSLRGTDLQSDQFQGVSLAGASLAQTALAKPLGRSPVLALTPDGTAIAVGDQSGCLLVWRTEDGRLEAGLRLGSSSAVSAIALSPDGKTLAEGHREGQVQLWSLPNISGPEVLAATANAAIQALTFDPQGQWLAAGDSAGTLYLWGLASGECYCQRLAHSGGIAAIAASPCGRFLTTSGRDGMAREWHADSGEPRHHFRGRVVAWLGTVGYGPGASSEDPPRAVTLGCDEGQIVLWEIASGFACRIMEGTCETVMAAAISPDGRYGAVGDVARTVRLWDLTTGQLLKTRNLNTLVHTLAFSPQGDRLMVSSDYQVQLWQVPSCDRWRTWGGHYPLATALALTGDSPPRILSAHPNHTLRCWGQDTLTPHWRPQTRLKLTFSGALRILATGSLNQMWIVGDEMELHLWHCGKQEWLGGIRPEAPLTTLALDATETWLALGDDQGNLSLWHLPTRTRQWSTPAHDRAIGAIAFAPDGETLVCGSHDHSLSGWDCQGQEWLRLGSHHRRIHTLCFAPEGHTLFSGSRDGTVRQWDLSTQTLMSTWESPRPLIYCITLDVEGTPLAVVGDTQTLEIWNLSQRQRSFTLDSPQPLWHVAPSADGCWLMTATTSGQITLWDLATGDMYGQLRVDRPYESMIIDGCQGLTEVERQMLYALGAVEG
ncbi:WD40 repeat domain-containing protein [Leptolyngbya sp. PCC 6406]|uniref:WD40 repeat domain-containing protein n=1 Tax=Leptolyngbya sp. PCC 6406 TaxID=1173264 RepID=UPI0002AC689D|nr:WD40 repeat domain-containing protein [Leptolyngbya sp. PCC 6406]